jgi:hypothetical protein
MGRCAVLAVPDRQFTKIRACIIAAEGIGGIERHWPTRQTKDFYAATMPHLAAPVVWGTIAAAQMIL